MLQHVAYFSLVCHFVKLITEHCWSYIPQNKVTDFLLVKHTQKKEKDKQL